MNDNRRIRIVLANGTELEGKSFGYPKSISGEVVFNTAMTGYPESLTDPSYKGQILVLTYPLIGNYGVPAMDVENNLFKNFESDRIHISGLVISDYSFNSSHWKSSKTLSAWLNENEIPGIYDVDTRLLTKILRENGTMPGKINYDNDEIEFYNPDNENLVSMVSVKEKQIYGSGRYRIILVDCGVKYNIIRRLLMRDTTVIRVPWNYDFTNDDYDGLFISNGPGDPVFCTETVKNIRKCLELDRPIFGICLGNQLLCLAAGGKTYKLKYGHRSHNQPVILKNSDRCFITSQNHGYAAEFNSLSDEWEEYFVNINDNTNEGIKHKTKPFFSAQFHPEASSGPTDTDFLFDLFIYNIKKYKGL